MEPSHMVNFLIRELRRRMSMAGYNSRSLSKAAGLNDTAVRDIVDGKSKNPKFDTLQKLATALKCTVADLTDDPEEQTSLGFAAPRVALAPLPAPAAPPAESQQIQFPAQGDSDVPVWASVEAGEDGAMVLTSGPIDFIRRSERMQGVRAPFAFYVLGKSMSPAIRHGDQVVINPGLPPRPGDDCIFIHDTEDGSMLALVKTLLRSTAEAWQVEQYNPAKTFTLSRKKWVRVLRVAEVRRG